MPDEPMDQIMQALVTFDNEISEKTTVAFNVIDKDDVTYYRFNASTGHFDLFEEDVEYDMIHVNFLEKINIDEFLDEVLAGNQIKKNKDLKRIIVNYETV